MTNPPDLAGSWVHSHEEDHDGIEVYRPAGYPFPPARGRTSLTLKPDGSARSGSPGPDDRGVAADGTWQLADSLLTVRSAGHTARFDVLAVDRDQLTLRPA